MQSGQLSSLEWLTYIPQVICMDLLHDAIGLISFPGRNNRVRQSLYSVTGSYLLH